MRNYLLVAAACAMLAGCSKKPTQVIEYIHDTTTVYDTLAIRVSTDSLLFRSMADSASLALTYRGTGTMVWRITSHPAWAEFTPDSGTVQSAVQIIRGRVDTAAAQQLSSGVHTDTMEIFSNAGSKRVRVRINVQQPYLEAWPDSVDFGLGTTTRTMMLHNNGGIAAVWRLVSEDAWLQGSPATGTLQPGDSAAITVTADRTGLGDGSYLGSAFFFSNGDQHYRVAASMQVYHEPFRRLGHKMAYANWSKALGVIVMTGDQPNRAYLYEPESGTETEIVLPLPPTCVTVSPDGHYAAVGHNGYISYLDLAAGTLKAVYPVTCDVLDVVLAGNGYVYAFPRTDQWEHIRCVRLSDSVETLHTGTDIYAGTKAKLHPSGQYIYGATNNVSPDNMEKYSVVAGTAAYLYKSPYWGDYNFWGDLWFSEDGLRIFARSGNVFHSSATQSQDMTYNGALSGIVNICFIGWLTHSQAAGKVFVAPVDSWYSTNRDTLVQIYDGAYLNYEQSQPLDRYLVNGALYQAHAKFVFVNAAGSRFYVVQQADAASGLTTCAVASYDYPLVKRFSRRR